MRREQKGDEQGFYTREAGSRRDHGSQHQAAEQEAVHSLMTIEVLFEASNEDVF